MSSRYLLRRRRRRAGGSSSGGGGETPMNRYLATVGYADDRFSVWDITDLENIVMLGSTGNSDFDLNTIRPILKLSGEPVLITASDVNGTVSMWSIENKASPSKLDDLTDTDYSDIRDLRQIGEFVYGPSRDDNYLAVLAIDLETPALTEHGSYDGAFTNFDGPQMCVGSPAGTHLYAPAFDDDGIEIINITNPASPSRVGLFQPTGISTDGTSCMTVKAGVMFFCEGNGNGDVWAIDITDESDPVETPLGTLSSATLDGARWCELSADGDYLYVATDTKFVVVSVANPASMSVVGNVALPAPAYEVRVGPDGYAYCPCGLDDSVQIIDAFTDPSTPAIVAEVQDATELNDCRGVAVWEEPAA